MIVEFVADIIDSFLGAWFIANVNGKSRTIGRKGLLFFILNSVITCTFSAFTSFSVIHTVLFSIILFIQSFLYNKISLTKKLLTPTIFMTIIIVTSSLASYLWTLLGNVSIEQLLTYGAAKRALLLLSQKIIMIIFLEVALRFLKKDITYTISNLILYLLSPIFTVIVLFLFIVIDFEFQIDKYYWTIFFSVIGLSVVNIISFRQFIKTSENARLEYELALLKHRTEIEKNTYIEIKNLYSKLEIARHDFKEQLSYLKDMSKTNASNISSLIDEVEKKVLSQKYYVQTENRAIDYVLCAKAEEYPDITFIVSGSLVEIHSLTSLELVSLIGNMLQNAIEAVENTHSKQVEIRFKKKGNYQNITCINPINKSVLQSNQDLITTKKDGAHGFGIKSMKYTVEKVGGLIEFYERDSSFFVHCVIPLETTFKTHSEKNSAPENK